MSYVVAGSVFDEGANRQKTGWLGKLTGGGRTLGVRIEAEVFPTEKAAQAAVERFCEKHRRFRVQVRFEPQRGS